MTDGIIKGTGNSRLLRTVANIFSLAPTWEAAAGMMARGEFPIDLNGINQDGWNVIGTLLNKANLLSDSTASAYGKGSTATVNEILSAARSLITTAQNTADSAQSSANSAQSKANSAYNIAVNAIEAGNYTGNGGTITITFKTHPFLVIIVQRTSGTGTGSAISFGCANVLGGSIINVAQGSSSASVRIKALTVTDRKIQWDGDGYNLSRSGAVYDYFSFQAIT